MNEPIDDFNGPDTDKKIAESLRSLSPRAPQLDWTAIHSAYSSDGSYDNAGTRRRLPLFRTVQPTVTWLSGIALGAAITFLIMHWFVLTDLRAKIRVLEQSVAENSPSSSTDRPPIDQTLSGYNNVYDSVYDLNEILDSKNLSVASYRGGRDRQTWNKAIDTPTESTSKENAVGSLLPLNSNDKSNNESDMNLEDAVKNQWRLLKEFEPKID